MISSSSFLVRSLSSLSLCSVVSLIRRKNSATSSDPSGDSPWTLVAIMDVEVSRSADGEKLLGVWFDCAGIVADERLYCSFMACSLQFGTRAE